MKNKSEKTSKGIAAFNTVCSIGIMFALLKLLDYLRWTFSLARKWTLPEDPFFSKVNLIYNDVEISLVAYLVFAIAYILVFGFIFLGLYQLNKTTQLFTKENIFQKEVGLAFKKVGNSFLYFAFGTLIIDIALLAWAKTSSRAIDLLSTEFLVFVILGYLMFFLSDVFKEGVMIKEENELTI